MIEDDVSVDPFVQVVSVVASVVVASVVVTVVVSLVPIVAVFIFSFSSMSRGFLHILLFIHLIFITFSW